MSALLLRRTLPSLLRRRPAVPFRSVAAAAGSPDRLSPWSVPSRPKTTSGGGYSPLNDPSPNWSNRPPKETILLDGCDYEHWLVVMEFADPKPSEDDMVVAYVKTLAHVFGRLEQSCS